MSSPLSSTSPATTYTSIPISSGDVISRSIHNLTTAISHHRPWSEFIASGVFYLPESLNSIPLRVKKNFQYFFINYALVVCICAALALVVNPLALLIDGIVFVLWLLLHFFREDPLLWGFPVGDHTVMVFLGLASVWAVWFTSSAVRLAEGLGVGLIICVVHSFFRNSDGHFLDEEDAVAGGLIGSNHH